MKIIQYAIPLAFISLALAQRPGDRQLVSGTHPSITVQNIRPSGWAWPIGGMDFMSDGRLVVTSWRDPYEVFIVSNAIVGSNPTSATVTKFATGLSEALGLKVVNDSIYVMEKDQLTLLLDINNDGTADEYRAVAYDWTKSVNEKEYAIGLVFDGAYFYSSYGDPTINSGTSVDPQPAGRLNGILRFNKATGSTEPFSGGMRVPGNMAMAYGQVWATEIQGGFRVSNHLYSPKLGRWYGRPVNPPSAFQPASVPNPTSNGTPYTSVEQLYSPTASNAVGATPPSVYIPFKTSGTSGGGPAGFQRSTTQPVEIKTGPFAGQLLIAESDNGESGSGEMVRVFMEQMPNGELQGAVFHFTRNSTFGGTAAPSGFSRNACFTLIPGPDGNIYCGGNGATSAGWGRNTSVGLDRISVSTAAAPFDILAVRNMGANSFEFEFTKPIAAGLTDAQVGRYIFSQKWWDRISNTYGCCRRNVAGANGVTDVTGMTAAVQANRNKVTVTFPGGALQQYWVHYFRWTDSLRTDQNETLYGTEAFYTLNAFGPGQAVSAVAPKAPMSQERPFTAFRTPGGDLQVRVTFPSDQDYAAQIADVSGKVVARREGRGSGVLSFPANSLPSGVYIVKIQSGSRVYSQIGFK